MHQDMNVHVVTSPWIHYTFIKSALYAHMLILLLTYPSVISNVNNDYLVIMSRTTPR